MAKIDSASKLVTCSWLVGRVPIIRSTGRVIVATSGVFDLWHDGHGSYLEDAGKMGDVLIVGVDSDKLVQDRKGPTRPIYGQDLRQKVVASCGAVDFTVLMEDWSAFMRIACPNIIVTSPTSEKADVEMQKRVAHDVGAKLVSLESRSPTHTSDIIRKILRTCSL